VELILGGPATLKKHALDSQYVRAFPSRGGLWNMTWWGIQGLTSSGTL
jgi:hypothetical protein